MITLQNVLYQFYHKFEQKYIPNAIQAKTAKDIMECRTAALGGHIFECDDCGHSTILYNSCRNRHCNLCQSLPKLTWVDKRTQDVINAPYFHIVFTVPEQLKILIYHNQNLLYTLLYKTVAETLLELSRDPKYLGAEIGLMSILHTWAQDLRYHPHIHTVVLAGGLTDSNQWAKSSKKFFIPVKVLAKKFRGKFLYFLKKYYDEGLLSFYGEAAQYEDKEGFTQLMNSCYSKNWYVYTKRTFSGPVAVIRYLANYTHRVAISNQRILSMDEKTVTISAKDRKNRNKRKTITLSGVEFVRRFLMHVLPKGFVKIRYYGLLANRNKKTKLELCRKLTKSQTYKSKFEGLKALKIIKIVTGKDITKCPYCLNGKLHAKLTLEPMRASP